MALLVVSTVLTVALIACGRAGNQFRAPITVAEWLAGSEIGLLLVTIGVGSFAEVFGFGCVLLALGGSALLFIASLAELIRIAWNRALITLRGRIDSLLCMLTMGTATMVILEVVSEPIWV